jgi:sulfite reductase beta subunit-like hemoprotein
MEPTTAGRIGSLENPEIVADVPGHIIPILEREFDDFDTEAGKFLAGQMEETEFIGFRLKQGVYGQRQAARQMIRVKLPFGGVNPEQLESLADAVEKYAPLNKAHLTTRQNFQIHHVPLDDAAKFIREISDSGLSSREGCGNTVRNVTGDPWAGLLDDEVFDPSPYVGAYVRYFVRHPTTQLMPRKIKTAFSPSPADRAIVGIHDIGFVAVEQDGVRGFRFVVGGGTSIMPRIAPTLYEFVRADDGEFLKVAEAVLRIYNRTDWLRPNRARARIKVLIDKIGIDAFRELVEEELKGDWVAERDFTPDLFLHDEEPNAPAVPSSVSSPNGDRAEFDRWVESNVVAQRQPGFNAATVRIVRGDLDPSQLRGLAAIMREYCGGYARSHINQNVVLRWVRDEALYDVWLRLKALDLGKSGAYEAVDTLSCPGTDSCKLGITSSMGLNKAIMDRLEALDIRDPYIRRIRINMSGCPNGCGQHHIAGIGFTGASIKVGDKTMPAYIVNIAGRAENGLVQYGRRLKLRLPSKRVPEAVERWLNMYLAGREEGEEFLDYADRVGNEAFEAAAKDLSLPVEFSLETMSEFIDWNRDVPFEVIRGEGECAV